MGAVVVLERGGVEVARWPLRLPVDGGGRVELVDQLARAHLVAKRRGCRLRLCSCSPEVLGLLDLVGLGDVLGPPGRR